MNDITCSGAIFYSVKTKRFLFLHRNDAKKKPVWGIVGGKIEANETPFESLQREIKEEVGFNPKIKKTIPIELFTSNDEKFSYHTYILLVDEEFLPALNDEHDGYAWVSNKQWPVPLHAGVKKTLNSKIIKDKMQTILDILG